MEKRFYYTFKVVAKFSLHETSYTTTNIVFWFARDYSKPISGPELSMLISEAWTEAGQIDGHIHAISIDDIVFVGEY